MRQFSSSIRNEQIFFDIINWSYDLFPYTHPFIAPHIYHAPTPACWSCFKFKWTLFLCVGVRNSRRVPLCYIYRFSSSLKYVLRRCSILGGMRLASAFTHCNNNVSLVLYTMCSVWWCHLFDFICPTSSTLCVLLFHFILLSYWFIFMILHMHMLSFMVIELTEFSIHGARNIMTLIFNL